MSVWSWLRGRLGGGSADRPEGVGGEPDAGAPDRHSTTGTTPNDVFVGRVAGEDPGYLETGAEKRAEAADEHDDDPTQSP